MSWTPKIGDRVRVKTFRTLPEFDGTIEEQLGPTRFNVRDDQGRLWFRVTKEMRLINRKWEAAE